MDDLREVRFKFSLTQPFQGALDLGTQRNKKLVGFDYLSSLYSSPPIVVWYHVFSKNLSAVYG
jgi:hypothetical protein